MKVIHTKKLHREILKRIENGETYRELGKETGVNRVTIKKWAHEGLVFEDGNENWHCPFCNKEFIHLLKLKLHIGACKDNENHRVFPKPPRVPHTEQSKKKLSIARKKYLKENPETHTYITLRNKESYPEKYFNDVFTNNNLNFKREVHIGTYCLDFYFPDYQIDFETDGNQHYTDAKIIESDKRRTEYLKENNITTVRLRWSEFSKLSYEEKENYIANLIQDMKTHDFEKTNAILYNNDLEQRITEFLVGKCKTYIDVSRAIGLGDKKWSHVKKYCIENNFELNSNIIETEPTIKCEICKCGTSKEYYEPTCEICAEKIIKDKEAKRKFQVTKEELEILVNKYPMTTVGKLLGVSDNAIRKRCRILGVDWPQPLNKKK